jgi:hypothetical protein
MHNGPADRRDIDAPKRFRWNIKGQQDRRPDHRRMRHRDGPYRAVGQRPQPSGYPVEQVDDLLTTVRRLGRIGQPYLEFPGVDAVEFLAAPPSVVEVSQPRLRCRLQA